MAEPVAVVVNPLAGSARTWLAELERIVGRRGFVAEVGTAAELVCFAQRAKQRQVAVVGICGGDGTLGRVATAVVREFGDAPCPALAPLGGGTMNTIARSLGWSRSSPDRVLRRILEGDSAVESVAQSTLEVNGSRLGFMLGAGVPARFLRLYERGARLGARRAVRVLGGLVCSAVVGGRAANELFATVEIGASIDGAELGLERVSIIYVAVIDDVGLGFRPTPLARQHPGAFQVIAADARAMDLVRALPRIRLGRGVGGPPWVDACAKSLVVAFSEATVYMIDGDVGEPVSDLAVRAGPILQMLVAKRIS